MRVLNYPATGKIFQDWSFNLQSKFFKVILYNSKVKRYLLGRF